MKKVVKIFMSLVLAVSMAGQLVPMVCMAAEAETKTIYASDAFKDNFESYEAESDIVSWRKVGAAAPTYGQVTPTDTYNWAEFLDNENSGFVPVEDTGISSGKISKLYNKGTTKYDVYRVSSKNVTGAAENNLIISGRFYIPDVSKINTFDIGLAPFNRYSNAVADFNPFILLGRIDSTGSFYNISTKIADVTIESGKWYRYAYMIENTNTKNYKGVLVDENGSMIANVSGTFTNATVSRDDATGDSMRAALQLGVAQSGSEDDNVVYVDDVGIYTADYGFEKDIPTSGIETNVTVKDTLTFNVMVPSVISKVYNVNADTISVVASNGEKKSITGISENQDASIDIYLAEELVSGEKYTIKVGDTDIFLNEIRNVEITFGAEQPVPPIKTVSAFLDDFESYEAGTDIVSWKKVGAANPLIGAVIPLDSYNWAEYLDEDKNGFEPVEVLQIKDGKIAKLYNKNTGSVYRVASKNVTEASTKNVIISGKFYIPDISGFGGFSIGMSQYNRFGSGDIPNWNPFIILGKVDNTGSFFNIDTKVEGITIEAGKWYRYAYMIENTVTKNYKGVLFDENGAVLTNVSGTFTNQTTSTGDDTGDSMRAAVNLGKAQSGNEDANVVFLDDMGIYTADYGFGKNIPTTEMVAEVSVADASKLILTGNAVLSAEHSIKAEDIILTDSDNNKITASSVTFNDDDMIEITLATAMDLNKEYTMTISGSDVFLNVITVQKPVVYGVSVGGAEFSKDGVEVKAVSNGKIDCTLKLYNTAAVASEGILVLALFRGDKLINVYYTDPISILAQKETTLTGSLNCVLEEGSEPAEYTMEAYVWNNIDDMIPVVSPIILGE